MSTLHLPDLDVISTGGAFNLSKYKGHNVVLYFYPKDNTPGCTSESKSFRDHHEEFVKKNVVILGVSRDSLKSHENFKNKYTLPFELIADTEETLCEHFKVLGEKSLFGKKYKGLIRSTFLISPEGEVIKAWRKVKVNGHVEEVLNSV